MCIQENSDRHLFFELRCGLAGATSEVSIRSPRTQRPYCIDFSNGEYLGLSSGSCSIICLIYASIGSSQLFRSMCCFMQQPRDPTKDNDMLF